MSSQLLSPAIQKETFFWATLFLALTSESWPTEKSANATNEDILKSCAFHPSCRCLSCQILNEVCNFRKTKRRFGEIVFWQIMSCTHKNRKTTRVRGNIFLWKTSQRAHNSCPDLPAWKRLSSRLLTDDCSFSCNQAAQKVSPQRAGNLFGHRPPPALTSNNLLILPPRLSVGLRNCPKLLYPGIIWALIRLPSTFQSTQAIKFPSASVPNISKFDFIPKLEQFHYSNTSFELDAAKARYLVWLGKRSHLGGERAEVGQKLEKLVR